ncbi:hypothetical protein AAG906_024376 [Vitis piasezkii]
MRRIREWVAYCRNDLGFGTVSRSFPEVLVCLDCRKLRGKVLQLSLEVRFVFSLSVFLDLEVCLIAEKADGKE